MPLTQAGTVRPTQCFCQDFFSFMEQKPNSKSLKPKGKKNGLNHETEIYKKQLVLALLLSQDSNYISQTPFLPVSHAFIRIYLSVPHSRGGKIVAKMHITCIAFIQVVTFSRPKAQSKSFFLSVSISEQVARSRRDVHRGGTGQVPVHV